MPARFPVDDLEDLVGVAVEDEDVDSVGGLMAKHLGVVPIPGSTVEVLGLQLTAEEAKGRRKKIGTVLVRRIEQEAPADDEDAPDRGEERRTRAERREDRSDRVRSSQGS